MEIKKQSVKTGDIFYSILKGKKLIIIFTLIGLIAGIMITSVSFIRGEMSKKYKIESSVLVSAQSKNGSFSEKSTNPKKEDLEMATDMTDAAMFVMQSNSTISKVIKKLNIVGVSATSIANNLTLTQYDETQIIEIALLWRNEDEGKKIINTLSEVSEDVLLDTIKVGNIETITEPSATYIFGGEINLSVLVYSTVGGLFVGIIICILKLLLKPTLIRPKDVEKLYGVELIGELPYNIDFAYSKPDSIEPEESDVEMTCIADVLMNRLNQAGVKSCYFTSIKNGEGKTKILADLAMKIADFGKKVLLVDCDINCPSLATEFGIDVKYENSLNALYNGDSDKFDAVIKINGCLSLLSIILVDNESNNLNLSMLELIQSLYKEFDYILIDAGSIGESSNVIRLNEITDTSVFVIKYDDATLYDIRRALLQLSKSGIALAGCIVNGTKTYTDVLINTEKKIASKQHLKRKTRK
jgi:Mrp family chromosome partitioning ATPase/capsular polysaccharide biosynthesis protein